MAILLERPFLYGRIDCGACVDRAATDPAQPDVAEPAAVFTGRCTADRFHLLRRDAIGVS
jgi:hypothetical protein